MSTETAEKPETLSDAQMNKELTEREFVIDLGNIKPKEIIAEVALAYIEKTAPDVFEGGMKKYVAQQIASLAPTVIELPNKKKVKLEGRLHRKFKDALFYAELERQLFVAGPAGSGKTTLAEQVAKALKLDFAFISCSAGLSEAHLLGRMLFNGDYVTSDFVRLYENGGVFLFDEIDAADANTMLVINSALANGVLSVPNRKENQYAKRHKDFICICAGNTWGSGSFEYHGRNQLDAAFLDRFAVSKLVVDYDTGLEKMICGEAEDLAKMLWALRKAVEKNRVRRVVSTRAFVSGARQIAAGLTVDKIVSTLMIGWSDEEKKKVKASLNLTEEVNPDEQPDGTDGDN